MIAAIENVWFSFVDSKLFAAVLTVITLAVIGLVLPAAASAIKDATAEGYTGTAVVQSHRTVGSFCEVEVMYPGNRVVRENKVFGPKMTCGNVTDGMEITMVKGNIQH